MVKSIPLSDSTYRYTIGRNHRQMMNTLRNESHSLSRGLCALCAATFLFFLLYTAPHRVHHFFDRAEPVSHANTDDHHDNSDQPNQASNDADCVFQTSANRCAAGLGTGVQSLITVWRHESFVVPLDHKQPHQYLSAPFQSRAPPIA